MHRRPAKRRHWLRHDTGGVEAGGGHDLAVSARFSKAYGQTSALPQVVINTLNLAFQLEYLEKYFYRPPWPSPSSSTTRTCTLPPSGVY